MPVGEAFLSAFLQVLFDRLASREFIELFQGRKCKDLLEKLKFTLLSVTSVLNEAEEKQFDCLAVGKWLCLAKDALYDAEDVLDELATEALVCRMEAELQAGGANKVQNWNCVSGSFNLFNRGLESRIIEIIERLEYIAKYKDVLGLKDDVVRGGLCGNNYRLPTTSLVDESCVFGRDNDKENLVAELLRVGDETCKSKIGVVPIVGMCGIGKTTLAQLAYNDDRVSKHFDRKFWVWVSDQFDVVRVTKTILRSVVPEAADVDDLNLLQVTLKERLVGEKFLLVLDDVWNQRNSDWDLLCNPLKQGARGSKIIVTSRNSDVASSVGTVPAHHLRVLPFEDCSSVFMSHAFENKNINVYPNLELIGREIVRKCEGLPLVAKRLGILLRSRQEEDEWEDILNRDVWDLPDEKNDILQSLRLSYHHLPAHLKQCFAYCSVFPKEYEFDKDSLVLLWMAEGFVRQPKGKKRLEEVGNQYFHELVSSSFFQQSIHSKSRFVMHGLTKDLAHFVSGEFSFRLDDELKDGKQSRISEKTRHSSYIHGIHEAKTKFEAFNEAECLRTFLPFDPIGGIGVSYMANTVPRDLLPKFRYLRSLSFSACRITELPDSIGNLKHLRYLDLSRTAIQRLPDSTTTLYNLQTLILTQCQSLTELPEEIGKLMSLRHLRISGNILREMPMQMCRLTNLQTLSNFVVGKDSGSGIRDLRDILQLQGALLISGLQNVISFMDAMDANLKDKLGLDELVLQWSNNIKEPIRNEEEESYKPQLHRNQKDLTSGADSGTKFPSFRETMKAYEQEAVESNLERSSSMAYSRNERSENQVLEMLQPHKNIKQLVIEDYGGTRFASWVGSLMFSNMVSLKLSNCQKCTHLPPLGQLASLKDLTIEGMEGLKTVGSEFYGDGSSSVMPFPSLEILKFDHMSRWEEWSSSGIGGRDEFHHLERLEVRNCPKLGKLLHHFPALKKMILMGCQELKALTQLPTLNYNFEQGSEFPCLLKLSIWACPNLTELPSVFPSLELLEIDGCEALAALPRLPSIRELEFKNCDEKVLQSAVKLTSLTYLRMCQITNLTCLREGFFKQLTALEELHIAYLSELNSLSNDSALQDLPYLQRLEISGCPCLKQLPHSLCRLSSLKELRVWNCPSLIIFPRTGLPSTLTGLEIKSCDALQFLPKWMMHDNNGVMSFLLEYLVIEDCSSLKSLPSGELPSRLKVLEIHNCVNLESLPKNMIDSLEIFEISGCHSLVSFPRGTFEATATSSSVMKLKQLIISNCSNLVSLPESLHNLMYLDHLEISDCPLLSTFPEPGLPNSKLQSMKLSNCRRLISLPNRMYSLTYLQELYIEGCCSLVSFPEGGLPTNLTTLTILDCVNLEPSYEWELHRVTSLTDFTFGGMPGLVSFPDEWLLPSNLSYLHLQRLPNLKSLPKGLKNLTALHNLEMWECDSLETLPEEGQSQMLESFRFWDVL